jgi:cullin 3
LQSLLNLTGAAPFGLAGFSSRMHTPRSTMATRRNNKFVISTFSHSVQTDPQYAQQTWATLHDAISKINDRQTSELSFEELYRYSYNMVLHKHGDILYKGLTTVLSEHLATIAVTVAGGTAVGAGTAAAQPVAGLRADSSCDFGAPERGGSTIVPADYAPTVFLTNLQTQWAWFKISLNHIRDILMYMDRKNLQTKKKKSVHNLGVSLFRDIVVRNLAINARLVETILEMIDCERNGESVDIHCIRAVTQMLAELGDDAAPLPSPGASSVYGCSSGVGANTVSSVAPYSSVYVNVFETPYLERTRQFYAREAQLHLAVSTCSDYLRLASKRIREEQQRVESYLDTQTSEKVRRVVEHELIKNHMTILVEMENSGLIWMLRNDKCYDLQLMYSLFRNVPNGDAKLRANLKNEVLERGIALVNDSERTSDPVALVSSVLALKEKYDRILKISFFAPSPSDSRLSAIDDPSHHYSHHHQLDTAGGTSSGLVGSPGGPKAGGVGSSSGLHRGATIGGSSSARTGPQHFRSCSSGKQVAERMPDRKFMNAVNEAFERFVNSFARAPEYISLFIDKLLREDIKGTGDDELETKLDAVMTLFRFLHEKDAFERYYKLHLSKRLLNNRTVSQDAERSFISKLKNECGYLFTSKMETMFTDMRTSAETSEAFCSEVVDTAAELCDVDLTVSVLTTISWPIVAVTPCIVPPVIAQCNKRYEAFYYGKHEGRRLTWQMHMASGELRGNFGNSTRTIDISLSAYGMCVLLLFNNVDALTYDHIATETKIPALELLRVLQSLAMGKHRVLSKEPRVREIMGTDVFAFNDSFSSRNRRVKVQMVSAQKETEVEKVESRSRIDEDRKPMIEAAIVRTMKDRKILEHQQLIAEVTAQLSPRFAPNPIEIKRRIENLVDKEYLERMPDMRSTYQYMA